MENRARHRTDTYILIPSHKIEELKGLKKMRVGGNNISYL
jgi:hypothetical protein